MRVKDTLNLGKTKFKMRGNLPVKEAERQKAWADNKVYQLRQKLNEGKPTFILHDGPPYANGDIHMGHALNKISKDFIVRYKSMNGFRAPYVPGWDTHGLPIEQKLTQQGYDRKKMSTVEFRKLCRQYALEQVDRQREEFKRLGVAGDWDDPYLTLKPEFEAQEVRVFGAFAKRGLIFKGKKPVFWSWSSESAMAEAEVEYHDVTSPSAFYGEQVVDGKGVLENGNTYMVVWTTTPWTIPASEGITVDANFDYSVVQPKGEDRKFVLATELVDDCAERFGWEDVKTLKTVKGKELDRVLTQHPFYPDRKLVTMLGDFVTLDAGTGLVHTAPGFGEDDFYVGQKYDLPILVPVDDKGYMTSEAGPDFEGVFYDDANKISLDKLKAANLLLDYMPYEHSYPFDWRTKKPVIFRATPQWFASVDKMRDEILAAIDDVQFFPDWGKKRLHNMIRDRGDWVISRQRVWGVPLPIFYGEDGEAIITPETTEHVAQLFEKYGSDVWFDRDAKDLLPEGFTSPHSPNGQFTKETDIMDVWFDSGSSHQGVLVERPELEYPADLYLEGSDQYRGWFNSSLITSVAVSGHAPYKAILSQGFTLDGEGHKMSKSLGNTIAPAEVIKKMGAEIVRLWVASVDSSADVRVSMDAFTKISDAYKKIRNTMRYMLANTSDFDPETDAVPVEELASADKYMLAQFNQFVESVKGHYDQYDFLDIYKELMNFVISDLSAFYLDFAKDILYIDAKDSRSRRSMQTVLYDIAAGMTKLLTPILPHTAEEVWPFLKESEDYAQLAEMPTVQHFNNEDQLVANWDAFMELRSDVLKSLEEARDQKLIGKASEAKLTLYLDDKQTKLLDDLDTDVRQVLLVSGLTVASMADAPANAENFNDGVAIVVAEADGEVCERCRMTRETVGDDKDYPHFCDRCAKIVRKEFPETVGVAFEEK
ncbi:isoleucine--tRNA ligase [Lactobacillus sp. LC28-10]|uniref:Isoleucine--tRNA ligase n=1 Tax=Secundilactobacillus angelensis TaxID=2722706 RepID=A0ABX1KZA9_9LACO|nr:isoleucine--tRNA ligase [Secundilactobacillus angelensis]MCH5463126.1 isoleucine--tRNA ligase [Secundilactobacillus angelensis]NLR18979.1 isoleucine--tRNA ligase [Secundilactobacillus angelensis]